MGEKITPEESRAIEAWLAENEPYRAKNGESGLYDEFGVPRRPNAEIDAKTMARVRVCREMLREGYDNSDIARRLKVSIQVVKHLRIRWLMG